MKAYLTAAELKHAIELPKCVKLYAPGAGNNDNVFIFPYGGRLSARKVSIMADDLAPFYRRMSYDQLERAIRNTAERCTWTHIETFPGRYGNLMCTFRGDGWMNMRSAEHVIIFKTVHGD